MEKFGSGGSGGSGITSRIRNNIPDPQHWKNTKKSVFNKDDLLLPLSVVQEFSSYSAYRQHVESVCEARVCACHICGKTFISVARLNTHVQARVHKKSFLLSFEI
jgi:hypothetical protein